MYAISETMSKIIVQNTPITVIEQGTDLKIVKELMGHNSIRTTEIYVHIADIFKSNIKSPLDDILEEDGLWIYLKKITAKSAVSITLIAKNNGKYRRI